MRVTYVIPGLSTFAIEEPNPFRAPGHLDIAGGRPVWVGYNGCGIGGTDTFKGARKKVLLSATELLQQKISLKQAELNVLRASLLKLTSGTVPETEQVLEQFRI